MTQEQFEVMAISGLRVSLYRGIAFLERKGEGDPDGHHVFKALRGKSVLELRSRFDAWIDRVNCAHHYHGWPNDDRFKVCFVFKWKVNRVGNRMYGFLCNPQPKTRPRFQLCVLCAHSTKTEQESDPTLLQRMVRLAGNANVKIAIAAQYPDRQLR